MATSCAMRGGEGTHSNPLNFLGEAPKFFKIVMNPQENGLRLPPKFVERYGQSLRNRVFFNVPNGSVHEVELIQINGETWIQRGWQEFKEKYSIEFGHLLLFEYDCNFHFNVYIFDPTAVEIEYPLDSAYNEGINLEKAGGLMLNTENNPISESDNSVEFVGKRLANLCERKSSGRKYYDLRVGSSSTSPNYQSEHTRVELEGSGGQATETGQRVLNKETCISYQRAKAFKSDNPSQNPFYIYVLPPSAIRWPCNLFIPTHFTRENLPRPCNNIKFFYDGKTWPVKCVLLPSGQGKISAGWPGFVKSNALKVGDTCIFEVNESNKLVWNVLIFHC